MGAAICGRHRLAAIVVISRILRCILGGFANVPFIIMGELFPSRYRSLLGPISSSFNLLCTFAVVRTFPEMQAALGKYGAFWLFMCCTLLSLLFVYQFLPETKGRTLEDIEHFFSKRHYSVATIAIDDLADQVKAENNEK